MLHKLFLRELCCNFVQRLRISIQTYPHPTNHRKFASEEAKVMVKVGHHPFVVHLLEAFTSKDKQTYFLTMPFCDSGSLQQVSTQEKIILDLCNVTTSVTRIFLTCCPAFFRSGRRFSIARDETASSFLRHKCCSGRSSCALHSTIFRQQTLCIEI